MRPTIPWALLSAGELVAVPAEVLLSYSSSTREFKLA
jgi:hypothetical protein